MTRFERWRGPSRWVLVFLAGSVISAAGIERAAADAANYGERTRWVAGRLIAPCCWTQTLDVHDSEVATALRLEIAERLVRGDTSSAIESDFAARYGARIRAVPAGSDPRLHIVALVAAIMGLSVFALVWYTRRARIRTHKGKVRWPSPADESAPDRYDAELEAELMSRPARSPYRN